MTSTVRRRDLALIQRDMTTALNRLREARARYDRCPSGENADAIREAGAALDKRMAEWDRAKIEEQADALARGEGL